MISQKNKSVKAALRNGEKDDKIEGKGGMKI